MNIIESIHAIKESQLLHKCKQEIDRFYLMHKDERESI